MPDIDAIRTGLVLILLLTTLMFLTPAPCAHRCGQCERERADRRLEDANRQRKHEEQVHHMWHVREVPGCPYCRRDSK